MQDEYLSRVVIDPTKRTFYLYSDSGNEHTVECDTVEQFMSVLELCRDQVPEGTLTYADPLF
jgi:hypothetical protein